MALKFPTGNEIALSLRTLSYSGRRWFFGLTALLVIALTGLLWLANDYFSVAIPAHGGSLTEGVIGTPLYVNPVLAASDTDRDLVALVYSGLMRVGPTGELIPDLAEKYEVSEDGLSYTFTLRPNLKWHDGQPLTVDDVLFTVSKVQDPLTKSPKRASWEGVTTERVDARTVRFSLRQPFGAFLETATLGLLPKHLWATFTPEQFLLNQLNTAGVGSGPYVVKSISKDSQGIAAEYHLASFDDFALGEPYLARVNLRFYPSETELLTAYERGEVESLSAISTEAAATLAARGTRIIDRPLTRIFGVFFNQGESAVFADPAVRQALDTATDRSALVSAILHGYGTPIDRPLPPVNATTTASADSSTPSTALIAAARVVLERGGWSWDPAAHRWSKKTKSGTLPLAFSLATSDAPELKATAQALKEMWGALGAQVDLKIYESGDLAKDVIRPREYEALFFGQILGRTPDLFSFWHSKQRLDPGYNIALYTNVGVDKLLEELRASRDLTEQRALANQIATAINRDDPAVFVYSPDFLYALPARIQGVNLPTINTPSDRFALIYQWYAETDKLWKIFKK